jgi:stage V sporulation protein B
LRKKRLLKNTALLSGSTLLMSLIGIAFQAWLAGRIGAAGIGLVQLVSSVTALGATFAISGIRFASTRLVAEELGAEHGEGVPAAMRRCLAYAALFGTAAGLILRFCAAPIGQGWIGDGRTVLSLRLSAFSMPCISLCAAISGYFTACGRLLRPTLIHLAEQLLGVALVVLFLRRAPDGNVEACCAAVVCGRLLADFASLLMMALACRDDLRRHFPLRASGRGQTERLLKIALPLASSAYARSGLGTAQQLLIPRGLRASGQSADRALAGYGVVHGMALPLLLFPACIPSAAAELIVPELTRDQTAGETRRIRRTIRAFLREGLLFSLAVGGFCFLCAEPLGMLLFRSAEAGRYIRLLSPLVPVMYTDLCVDGCLKGLGQQGWSMGINILDALSGLVLVWLLLPRWGLAGYLAVIYATETLNFLLSSLRLVRVCRAMPAEAGRRSPARPA